MPNDTKPLPSRLIDWAALVRQAWGPEFYQPDVSFQFSNGREFKSTDSADGGVYGVTITDYIAQETIDPATLRSIDFLLTEAGERLIQE